MFEPAFLHKMENSPSKRFAVYNNNVTLSLKEGMKANFPCVLKLVGDDFFDFLSATYLQQNPPTSKLMFQLGEQFPSYIKTVKQAEDLPFLSDVASLEQHLRLSYHAKDAEPLTVKDFQAIPPEKLGDCVFTLHPSLYLLKSDTPFISIYEDCMGLNSHENISFEAEFGVVFRENFDVSVQKCDEATFKFLENISLRKPLAECFDENDDAAKLLTLLMHNNFITGKTYEKRD